MRHADGRHVMIQRSTVRLEALPRESGSMRPAPEACNEHDEETPLARRIDCLDPGRLAHDGGRGLSAGNPLQFQDLDWSHTRDRVISQVRAGRGYGRAQGRRDQTAAREARTGRSRRRDGVEGDKTGPLRRLLGELQIRDRRLPARQGARARHGSADGREAGQWRDRGGGDVGVADAEFRGLGGVPGRRA